MTCSNLPCGGGHDVPEPRTPVVNRSVDAGVTTPCDARERGRQVVAQRRNPA
jgi:hypothetical protein